MTEKIYPEQRRFPKKMSPYPCKELLKWGWHNVSMRKKNDGNVQFLPKNYVFNSVKPDIQIGFLGDVMDTGNRKVIFSQKIKEFLSSCDFLVVNWEGTIYNGKKESVMDQKIIKTTIESLKSLKDSHKIYLSLANNHTGDFSQHIYDESLGLLKSNGFNVFGTIEKPVINLGYDQIQLWGSTHWSNKLRGWGRVSQTHIIEEEITKSFELNTFKIFYPHWGYELELYPRTQTIQLAEKYLKLFDCIIGHHSHYPQPISKINDKLIAYSLGDVCFRGTSRILYKYCFGEILKISLGKDSDGIRKINQLNWEFIESNFHRNNIVDVEIAKKLPK